MTSCPDCGATTVAHCTHPYCVADWCPRAVCGWDSGIHCPQTVAPLNPWEADQRRDGESKRHYKPVTIIGKRSPVTGTSWGWAFDYKHPAPSWPSEELDGMLALDNDIAILCAKR